MTDSFIVQPPQFHITPLALLSSSLTFRLQTRPFRRLVPSSESTFTASGFRHCSPTLPSEARHHRCEFTFYPSSPQPWGLSPGLDNYLPRRTHTYGRGFGWPAEEANACCTLLIILFSSANNWPPYPIFPIGFVPPLLNMAQYVGNHGLPMHHQHLTLDNTTTMNDYSHPSPPPEIEATIQHRQPQVSRDHCDRRRPDEEDDSRLSKTKMPMDLAGKTVSPFLKEHIPGIYAPVGKGRHIDGSSTDIVARQKDPNSKFCYRHRPDSKCRRAADETKMGFIQRVTTPTPVLLGI